MTFDEILEQVITLLKRQGRVSYSALRRRFDLDEAYLEDLKDELLFSHSVVDEDGRGLVWPGGADATSVSASQTDKNEPQPTSQQDHLSQTEPPSPTESPTPDAERRQLTVMFCDLADSTKLSGQLDPEDLRDVIRAYQSTSAEVIQRYDGHIAQYLGDGLLVYFGWPQAHEDDAQRALHAGLGIVEAIKTSLNPRLQQEKGVQLTVRIGVHTGPVVVGEMGGGGRHENLATGETVNIAARLEGLAQPNTVVISDTTYQLIEGYFNCDDLGTQPLKGVATPMQAYGVRQATGAQGRLEVAMIRGLTPLVGREQEVGLLIERWAQVKDGQGQVILLSGEAGIGKSRLFQVLKDHVAEEPHTRLECQSSPYYQNTALYPITDLLQRTLEWQPDDSPQKRLEKLEQMLRQYRLPLDESVPLFATLLSLPVPEEQYPPLTMTPQRQRQKTLEAIVAILLEQAERQPVLFILEDLHWTDPSTLEVLDLLMDQAATAAMLVLLTCRPEFEPPWGLRSHLTPIALNRFTRSQVEGMVERLTEGKALPAEVIQQIVEKTDGVPLFVEELTKSILESGVLQETNGHYELAGPLASLAIPTTLQDSLMARLDRLGTAKNIAQLGATIGRQFTYELLHAVSPSDEEALQRELGRLVAAELVYQRGMGSQATYGFKHALIQDAAYQSLLRSTRQQVHQQIARVLEEQFPETVENQPELLAHHAFHGAVWDKAFTYFRRVGATAERQAAYREAVQCWEQALTAWRHLSPSRDMAEQGFDLLCSMRQVHVYLGTFERGFDYLREAETLVEALNDPERLGRLHALMSHHFFHTGDYERGVEQSQRALELLAESSDDALRTEVSFRLGQLYHALGRYHEALDIFRRDVPFHQRTLGPSRGVALLRRDIGNFTWVTLCIEELGAFVEGIAHGEEAVRMAEAVNNPSSIVFAQMCLGRLMLRQGDMPQAISVLERALMRCHEADFPLWTFQLAIHLALAHATINRIAEALALLEEAASVNLGNSAIIGRMGAKRGEAYLLCGRVEEAFSHAMRTLELLRARNGRGDQAWVLRLLGDIAMHRDPPEIDQAETHFQQALSLANELGMRPLQAHCYRGLGTMYSQTGQSEQARAELSTAIDMYRDMEMTFWLPQAEAALAEVDGQS